MSSDVIDLHISVIHESFYPQLASPAFQSQLLAIAEQLSAQENLLQDTFNKEKTGQGAIGKAFDAAKNFAGTDRDGNVETTPGWLWAQLLDRKVGSDASQEALNSAAAEIRDLKQAADSDDLVKFGSLYHNLTGKEYDKDKTMADSLAVKKTVENYHASQANGVEFISDLGSVATVLTALRLGRGTLLTGSLNARLATGFFAGAASKCVLKKVDGRYANLPLDLLTGGTNGLAFPAAEKMSLSFGGEPFRHAIAVAAGTENASRTFVDEVREGHHIDGYQLVNNAITGYGIGYASATALFRSIPALSKFIF